MLTVSRFRRCTPIALVLSIALVLAIGPAPSAAQGPPALQFIENSGQVDPDAAYHVEGATHSILFEAGAAEIAERSGGSVGEVYVDASDAASAGPMGGETTRASFFFANGGRPVTDTSVFDSIQFVGVYPGIDVTYSGVYGRLDHTLTVAPGGDPSDIRLRYDNATDVSSGPGEALTVAAPGGTLTGAPPFAFQDIGGSRVLVAVSLTVHADDTVSLTLGGYDTAEPLLIELELDYSDMLDGPPVDEGRGMHSPDGEILLTSASGAAGGFASALANVSFGDGLTGGSPPESEIDALIVGGDLAGADLIPADGDVLSGTFTNVGQFAVGAGITVFVDPGVPLVIEAETILVEGVVNADGAGYSGGATNPVFGVDGLPGGGPGGGSGGEFGPCVHGNGGGGGGYGGAGGNSSSLFTTQQPPSLGGPAYGSAGPPGVMMGSGGGSGGNYCSEANGGPGGAGGGSVTLSGVLVTIPGTITADGDDGTLIDSPGPGGGGGSGGGIWLSGCLTLTDAVLSAEGGLGAGQTSGFSQGGGGGAGGRIKLSGTIAPGSVYGAAVIGGAGGPHGGISSSTASTPGAVGTVVDLSEDNGGPCELAADSVGGFAVGEVSTESSAAAMTVADDSRSQINAGLALIAGGMLAISAAWGVRQGRSRLR